MRPLIIRRDSPKEHFDEHYGLFAAKLKSPGSCKYVYVSTADVMKFSSQITFLFLFMKIHSCGRLGAADYFPDF